MATTEEATMATDAVTTEKPTSAVLCSDLTITNGATVYSGGSPDNRPVESTATHSCDNSFNLVGEAVRTCGSTGEWSGSAPTCVVVCMDLVVEPLTGSVVYDMGSKDSRPLGTMATYTCSTGYMVVGSVTVTCQVDRTWNDSATCELVCPDLSEPDNGNIVYSETIPRGIDSTATYSCTTAGYQLVGITERMCTASGWSTGTDPTCILVTVVSTATPTAGLNYSLTCTAELSTTATPTFQWFQDGSVITVGDTRSIVGGGETTSPYTNTLNFSPIQQSHQGAYICQVTVDTVSASSPPIDITVTIPTVMAAVTLAPSPMAGQSYSLTCAVTGAEALTPTISYQWFEETNSRVILPTTITDLTFDPLNLSDAGQYSCDVMVSSPFLTSDLTASSEVEDLIIQIPPPTVSVSQPPTVFLGGMFTLTCTAVLAASVDVGVDVGVVWTGPDQFTSSNTMASLTAEASSHASQLMVASAAQSGNYMCAVTLDSASNFLTESDPATQVRPISVVGAPSSPVVTSVPQQDSITFTWTQDDQSDVVVTYNFVFEYNGSCSVTTPPMSVSGFFITTTNPTNLFSFSNYRLTVTAVNPVGSNTTVVIVTTLPKAPSGPVLNLVASSFNSTSVTIQWDRVSCVQRNSDITGYQISYDGDPVNVTGTDVREFTASGLIPRTQYTFLVTPLSNSGMGTEVASVVRETSPAEELSLFLGGQFLSNHDLVTPSDIGDTNNALLCLTPVLDCCENSNGDWFFPSGPAVPVSLAGQSLFSDRDASVVRLNRRSDNVDSGVYRCELLSAVGVSVSLHVGLYPLDEGSPTIPGDLMFNRASLTLTCVSNGGPASEVVWTRNGATVSTGYTLTQIVNNTATATYENILTAATIADLVGTFTCTVNNRRGTSNTVSFSFNGIDIDGVEGLVVGSDAALRCVSVSPTTMIQWINSAGDNVAMTTTGLTLDLPFAPVTDTLHNSEFTCRVTRSPSNGGTGELSTTLTVTVPVSVLNVSITSPSAVVAGSDYTFRCEVTKVTLGLADTPIALWVASDGQQITTGGNVIITNPSTGLTELSFTGIRTNQAGQYVCRGTLTSPALMVARETTDTVNVIIQLPPPTVILTTPTSPLTAGTSQELTCSVTVVTAVTTDVSVSVTLERIRGSEVVAITTVTLNEKASSTPVILTVNTMDTDYTCRAMYMTTSGVMSPPGEGTQAITIMIPLPPVVTINVSGDSVAGSSLSLLCTATPPIPLVTPPTVSWVQQDLADIVTPVTSNPSASVNLTFDPLRTSRGGIYMCIADYNILDADLPDLPNTASTIVSVQILRPDARITFDPMMDNYTVGLFLTLGCEVTLSSAIDTMVTLDPIWRREGVELTTRDQLTVGPFKNLTRTNTNDDQVYTSLLEFLPLTRDFIGNDTLYECEASVMPQSDTFITGTITNTSTTLTVGVADFAASISSDSTLLAGSNHTLVCQGVRGDDQANGTTLEVEWFNPDGVLITGETSGVMITGVTDITTNPTLMSSLIFPSLQTSQAGPYTCRVNHTIPDTTITDQSILSSSVVTVQINTPQVMINASRSATLYEGTTGQVLRCVVTPDNAGVNTTTSVTRDITGGVDRATTSDTVSDGVIIVEEAIQVLSLSDTGTYTCSATVDSEPNNMYIMSATNTDILSITVEVLPVPVVEISPSSPLPVLAGSSLNLNCSVSVEDLLSVEPLIQWTTLSDQSLSGVLNGRTNTLTFDPLLTTNATQYTCTATINIPAVDITSTGSSSTDLTVDIPPPTVSVSSPTPVYHGTNHTLSCNAGYDTSVVTTAVTLDYSWTGPNLIASSDSAALTLSPVDLPAQSSGNYTCTVSVIPAVSTFINNGSDSDTYNLTVLDAPPPEVLTGVPVREERCGQVSSITCTASVIDNFVATPTFMWRGPGGDIVDSDNILNLPSVRTGGEYTCMACVNVSQVNIINLCTNSTITIQTTTPQPVSDVVCSSLSPSTLSVSWSPPTNPVLSYQVEVKQYSLVGSTVDTVSLSTPFDSENIITNTTVNVLAASTRYLVSVEAVSGVGCSDVTEIDCYTQQTDPPIVQDVTAERLNGTAMNVSWTQLNKAQSNGFIQSYIVTYSVVTATPNRKRQGSQQVTVSSDKSGTIIGGLDPGSEYSVGVSASGPGGTSQSSPLMVSPTIAPTPNNLGIIIGVIVVVLVLIVAITITIIVIMCLVKRHQARDKYRLKTDRNFELASMDPTTTIEPTTAHHPLGGDELEHAESEKAKEALNGAEEVVAVATVTPAEVLDRLNPVSLTSFRSHVQNMHDDRAKGFEAEYQSFSMDPLEAHEEAKIPHNRLKNRFANIYPYDHSRVLLNAVPGVAGSEYINACWLEGYQRPKAYIAAQGPMPTSLDDFWRMIWEYKLANIVMLTRCKEGGRVKCEQYWAEDIGGVFETENKSVSVTTLSVTTYADFVIRQFTVKNNHQAGSEPLKVTQFHFTAWPDHGVPKFATSLISFIRKTQRVHNKESGVPLLVHCSAGVGRTGTFITLDAMLERIHSETSVNVYAFVKAMRKNRVLMVQTLAQYSFIHDALDELITCGETDIPAGALRTKVNLLSKVIPGKGITGFTNQFQLLEEVSRVPDPEDVNDANEHFNKDKNRYPDRVPYNMSRARLRPSGEDGSEYINASFIDGYKQRNAYIAAQGPLRNTVDDFWRMIWEFKSKTVAMVCNSEEGGQESAAPYWPPKEDEPVLYGKITVTLQAKAAYGDFTVRKFTIQEEKAANGKQMDGFTVTLFHHTEWPLDGRPKTGTLIEMLDMITKSQMSTGNRPITVMCNDGVGRTGTFICIHAQLERLKTEGVVDFFQSIKLARIQRAGLVPDVTNYAFCHEVLADFIDKFDNYANFKDMI